MLFGLAVIAIVLAIDAVILLTLGVTTAGEQGQILSANELVDRNASLLIWGAVLTAGTIGIASAVRMASLASGGGSVARAMGGTLVEADSRDPLRRRLNNVVEEIALASGVPVPEVYVLEQESAINAFAAGYAPADAAVAVTRGALEKLNRNELQGVIAHEFSHILNGDMRVNIRLMGVLFGILMLALVGRRVLMHAHLVGRGSRDKGGVAVLAIAAALMAVGYLGLFFGRWIKAAVSRQREYLADASAVQFTRDPDSIGGALKKIAVYSESSLLNVDSEEVSHMLFGAGRRMSLMSTHPPLVDRIKRVDSSFRAEELDTLAKQILRDQVREKEKARERAEARAESSQPGTSFDADTLINGIGNPQWERMLMAAALAASIPEPVSRAAHSAEWAPEVLFYALLDHDPEVVERQRLVVAQSMGEESERQLGALVQASGLPEPQQRLPLLEVAFPALKRRPPEYIEQVLKTAEAMIAADGRTDVFEYLLSRLVRQYIEEAARPQAVKWSGKLKIEKNAELVASLLTVLARHGNDRAESALAAYRAGMDSLGLDVDMPRVNDWVEAMDQSLAKLDELRPEDKQRLVKALITVVTHDGDLRPTELELLRVSCDLVHVPMPMLTASRQTSRQS